MNAAGQYFPVVLFIRRYMVVLIFEYVEKILKCDIQAKAIEGYLTLVLFILRLKAECRRDLFKASGHYME